MYCSKTASWSLAARVWIALVASHADLWEGGRLRGVVAQCRAHVEGEAERVAPGGRGLKLPAAGVAGGREERRRLVRFQAVGDDPEVGDDESSGGRPGAVGAEPLGHRVHELLGKVVVHPPPVRARANGRTAARGIRAQVRSFGAVPVTTTTSPTAITTVTPTGRSSPGIDVSAGHPPSSDVTSDPDNPSCPPPLA